MYVLRMSGGIGFRVEIFEMVVLFFGFLEFFFFEDYKYLVIFREVCVWKG